MPAPSDKSTSLAKSRVLLLVGPVIAQIGFIILVIALQLETDFYPRRAAQDIEISDSMGNYLLTGLATLNSIDKYLASEGPESDCDKYPERLKDQATKLTQQWVTFPQRRSEVIVFKNEQYSDKL